MLDRIWLIIIIMLILISIKLSIKIKFKNLRIRYLLNNIKYKNLFLSLGTKMGVGSIIGITSAICIGGPGTVLWIYIFGILSSSIIFFESKLSIKYKKKDFSNSYLIIKDGLNKKTMSIFYVILFIFTYCILFMMLQTNTLSNLLNINKIILIFPLIILYLIIIKNINLDNIICILITLINILICTLCIYAISKNIKIMPKIYLKIILNAFNKKTIFIGMIIGIKRAVFLNELLIGTTEINTFNKKNIDTTNSMILSSYYINLFITFLISSTILIYLYYNKNIDLKYFEILKNTFIFHFNEKGELLLDIIITSLSYSTILSGINIGKKSILIFKKNKLLIIYYLLTITLLIISLFINTKIIWNMIDLFMLIIIIINGTTIYLLKNNIEE